MNGLSRYSAYNFGRIATNSTDTWTPNNSTLYVGLSTTTFDLNGAGISRPPSSGGYESISTNQSNWETSAGNTVTSKYQLAFNVTTSDWGTVRAVSITNGTDYIWGGVLEAAVSVPINRIVVFLANDLTITL